MKIFYLRAECVNLSNFIYDTHDISAIRGGSFLIREAINQKEEWEKLNLKVISLEANIGLFSFEAHDEEEAKKIRNKVITKLNEKCHNHATFVVDIHQKTGSFLKDVQELIAKNRWRQFRELTGRLPTAPANQYCDLDGIMPAAQPIIKGNETKIISESVFFRRKEGIFLRRNLYQKLFKKNHIDFTDDLETLAKSPDKGNLDGKIAFIYIDGNRFGKIRDQLCTSEETLANYQSYLQKEIRSEAMKRILNYAQNTKSFKTNDNKIRLEMLMWGGDEIELVVPSWMAWRTLKLFFENSNNSKFENIFLTHSAGIVLCHAKAPILHIRRLARSLCEAIKELIPTDHHTLSSSENLLSFLVLDSFDQVNTEAYTFVHNYFLPATIRDLIIKADEIDDIEKYLIHLKKYFPRNKVYEIINYIRKNKDGIQDIISYSTKKIEPSARKLTTEAINTMTSSETKRWFLISDLWDFIGAEGGNE